VCGRPPNRASQRPRHHCPKPRQTPLPEPNPPPQDAPSIPLHPTTHKSGRPVRVGLLEPFSAGLQRIYNGHTASMPGVAPVHAERMPSRTDVRQSAATIKPSAVADAASAISELRRRGVYCRRYGPVVLPLADASLGPAIVGLVGVTLGALISGVFGWRGEAHRERRRARAAARLLRSDLFMFSRLLRNGIARAIPIPSLVSWGPIARPAHWRISG
jgi:hypothetical protein